MDRLVKADTKEVEMIFLKGQKCSSSFKLTNLMHTMSVAVSLTTTNSSLFSINKPFSTIPPLSTASYKLQLSQPSDQPPLSDPPDAITVRATVLPTGKASAADLRRFFSKPGPHVFRDAVLTVSLVGLHVAEFLISQTPQSRNLFAKSISACTKPQLTRLLKPAVECGSTDAVADLLNAGADANATSESLMPLAIRDGNLHAVKLLEASGCKIDGSSLHEAAAMDRIDAMEFLLARYDSELDVDAVDYDGRTAMHVAAREGHARVIQICVTKGGNPNRVDSKGWTPLHYAAWKGHVKAAECLLECSNVKWARDREGRTAFTVAAESEHEHSHARTRLVDLLGWGDALLRAVRVDNVDGVKKCLGEGVSVNGRDQNGWSPLHWAALKGGIKSLKVLLEHGAEVDTVDDAGYTPLHCAAEAGHLQVALYLIAHGASQANLKSFPHLPHPLHLDPFQNQVSLHSKSKTIV